MINKVWNIFKSTIKLIIMVAVLLGAIGLLIPNKEDEVVIDTNSKVYMDNYAKITVRKAETGTNWSFDDFVALTYVFTNMSEEPRSDYENFDFEFYQNGKELEQLEYSYEQEDNVRLTKNNPSEDIKVAAKINDNSPVEVHLVDYYNIGDDILAKFKIDLNTNHVTRIK